MIAWQLALVLALLAFGAGAVMARAVILAAWRSNAAIRTILEGRGPEYHR